MSLSQDALSELRILSLFNPGSSQEGIKVHQNADPEDLAATQRLFEKGLITLPDGGYLTTLGQDAIRKLDELAMILTTEPKLGAASKAAL